MAFLIGKADASGLLRTHYQQPPSPPTTLLLFADHSQAPAASGALPALVDGVADGFEYEIGPTTTGAHSFTIRGIALSPIGTPQKMLSDSMADAISYLDTIDLNRFAFEPLSAQWSSLDPANFGQLYLDVTSLTRAVSVPEPSSMLLFGIGLFGLICASRLRGS